MKTRLFLAMTVLTMFVFAGCANKSGETMTTTDTSSTANPTDRAYSQKDLSHTGRAQTGEAVQSLEPATR